MSETLLSSRNLASELYEVLDAEAPTQRPRFTEHSHETFDVALGTARNLVEELFAPHNRKDGEYEPLCKNDLTTLIPEVKPVVDTLLNAGFLNAAHSLEQDGMQPPTLLSQTYLAHFQAADAGSSAYPFLTMGAANLVKNFGSEERKRHFLQPITEGRLFGTTALTESHAGFSPSDIRIRVEPVADGSYRIKSNKIFIFGGDHPFSENIAHTALAKLSDALPGVKGIPLFIVPKFLVNADGSLGPRSDVILVGLFHKMGYRGTTPTALNFGDNGTCIGCLMGRPHHGPAYMFQMMNEVYIGVGTGAVMLGYAGCLYLLEYVYERPQGRLSDGKDPSASQMAIIRHTDVRRVLLTQKARVEGAFDLDLHATRLLGDSRTLEDDERHRQAHELLNLLIPIIKSWPSGFCLKASELAVQVLGGHGYTREYPIEQYYRDNRLNSIHGGTHGIQSLDLLGHKAGQSNGAGLHQLTRLIQDACRRAETHSSLAALCQPLERPVAWLSEVILALLDDLMQSQVNQSLVNLTLYLKVFGHAVIGWHWLEQAVRTEEGLARGDCADADLYRGKLQAARYSPTREVPGCHHELALLETRDDVCSSIQEE